MYEYNKLQNKLNEKGINKSDLTRLLGLSSRTIAKISKGKKLSNNTIIRISDYLLCEPQEIYRVVSDNHILQILRDEKNAGISGGLYHELQVRMTYNSNHIEGSKLTEEQTRMIFETNTIGAETIPVDDILETVHHFRAIDYVIDNAEENLTEEFIKHLHLIIKRDTLDSTLPWFIVGDYKRRVNAVGGRKTANPAEVPKKMKKLMEQYSETKEKTIENIIAFHAEFERIHPFQDGNGRVGRLITLKECLHYNIIPFIIEDSKKYFYYRGLDKWGTENGYLIDTCLDGQDTFKSLLDMFEIKY
ncbi:MAG: Fic family protein [Lachnospiraceae bacterium]|nr:Fic family protein [Erysipelotrichaceae bacterium]MBR4342467.1 Fic family protein [Lachnospiraceae bacterium]